MRIAINHQRYGSMDRRTVWLIRVFRHFNVSWSMAKGYICEYTIPKCKSINRLEFPNIIIIPPPSRVAETVDFDEAKAKCRSLPGHRPSSWRLFRFTKQTRQLWYARLQQLLDENCMMEMSWWIDFEQGFEKYKFAQPMSEVGIFWYLYGRQHWIKYARLTLM